VELIRPVFTETYDFCLDNFFSDQIRKDQLVGELLRYIFKPRDLPSPVECGKRKSRLKEWLPLTNVFVYYWDFGRVWEIFGVVEKGNVKQLEELKRLSDELEAKNDT